MEPKYVTLADTKLQLSDFSKFTMTAIFGIFGIFIYVIITGVILRDPMNSLSEKILYPLIASIVTLIFLVTLIYRSIKAHIQGIQYLILFGFSSFAFNLLQVFDWDTAVEHNPFVRPLNHRILNVADALIVLMVLFMYLHFETLSNYRVYAPRMLLMSLILFPMLVLNLLVFITQENKLNQVLELLLPLFSLAVIFGVIFGLQTTIKIYFTNEDQTIKFGALIMMSSINGMMFAFASQPLTSDEINFVLFKGVIFQLLLFAIATSFLSVVYIKNPQFLYAHPFNIYEILIYDQNGIPVWNHHFSSAISQSNQENILKAAALSAIGNVIKEVTGFRGKIQNVEFSDGELIISKTGEFYVCLISDKRTVPLIGSLKQFGKNATPIIHKATQLQDGNVQRESLDTELFVLLKKYFPFVNNQPQIS